MKVLTITVTRAVHINIAQFENERIEITKTVELSSKDDSDEVEKELLSGMRDVLYEEEAKVLKSLKKRRPKLEKD